MEGEERNRNKRDRRILQEDIGDRMSTKQFGKVGGVPVLIWYQSRADVRAEQEMEGMHHLVTIIVPTVRSPIREGLQAFSCKHAAREISNR